MPWFDVVWDLPDDPNGNVQHIAEHGLTPPDIEYVLNNPRRRVVSRSSGRPMVFGRTPSGEEIVVVYDELDDSTVYPVTAYQVEE
ncbi:MAG: hypothetical protein AB7G28_21210 [Pirellulales bacterium]